MKFLGFIREDVMSRFREVSRKDLLLAGKVDDDRGGQAATEEMDRSFEGAEVRGWSVRRRRLDRVIGVRARKDLMELREVNFLS